MFEAYRPAFIWTYEVFCSIDASCDGVAASHVIVANILVIFMALPLPQRLWFLGDIYSLWFHRCASGFASLGGAK